MSRLLPNLIRRTYSSLNRPAPIPLPREQQREFELLQRAAQTPLANAAPDDFQLHPDAREPLKPEFEGDINPTTGEQGGPKREPVGRWAEGDWSFKGRVSDF
ncbi:hypothetical protein B0H17DRAFT_1041863 [Mycena rosella]|uniref:Succinate dehydrogenase assembly factor 4, mitochondrial n=1 Tax=Mycena rosella TaxID=1033263 RepID=A0AAD7DZ52_MYCRO|nr:hypothetical protein B0H17DRAFT_1041863 [Mycena rosella]